jgi:uncharacterized protein with PhoU and TrkA domain
MDDQPKSVKDLLVEAKDASELMVDLAYAAVFFNEDKLASEVERLEERMTGHLRRLREVAMLAARSPEDAEGMAGVLWIASAIEKIGDAASDIARVVQARLGIPDALRRDLRHADEMTARVKVRASALVIGRALRELSLPTETGMGDGDPQRDRVAVRPRTRRRAVRRATSCWSAAPRRASHSCESSRAPRPTRTTRRRRAAALRARPSGGHLVELKDQSEAAVGLAYSSILFNNRALAAEVGALEARSDALHDELESWVLRAAPEARNPDELRGLLRLGSASESMCDAARDLPGTWSMASRCTVVQLALEETEETSAETVVDQGPAAGRSLKDLRLETETGMFVLAVQRGARWIYRPRSAFTLQEGDRLISVGPEEGEEELWALTGAPLAVEG